MGPVSIRPIVENDLVAAAGLLTELGYPSTAEQMRGRIARILLHPDLVGFVAEADSAILGLATADVFPSIEHDAPVARITAMVVTERARGTGVGAALVAAIEAWAKARGVKRITVTSHVRRDGAHAFYRRLGYAETGKRFLREL